MIHSDTLNYNPIQCIIKLIVIVSTYQEEDGNTLVRTVAIRKCFRRYVDEETGKELADDCGICDHANRCGYHYPPRELFRDHPELRPENGQNSWQNNVGRGFPSRDSANVGRSLLSRDSANVGRSLLSRDSANVGRGFPSRFALSYGSQIFALQDEYHQTEFFPLVWAERAAERESTFSRWFMQLPYDDELKRRVLREYYVGAKEKDVFVNGINRGKAVVFWMIDEQQRVHDAKLMAYHEDGHRVQGWGNSMRSICEKAKKGPQLEQTEKVLFGLHLLPRYPDKTVCLVESEKTALICACHYPQYLWLATGGCGNLQQQKLRPLMNRTIVVYPDSGEYQKWSQRMRESGHRNYIVMDIMEKYEPNTDIADVIAP